MSTCLVIICFMLLSMYYNQNAFSHVLLDVVPSGYNVPNPIPKSDPNAGTTISSMNSMQTATNPNEMVTTTPPAGITALNTGQPNTSVSQGLTTQLPPPTDAGFQSTPGQSIAPGYGIGPGGQPPPQGSLNSSLPPVSPLPNQVSSGMPTGPVSSTAIDGDLAPAVTTLLGNGTGVVGAVLSQNNESAGSMPAPVPSPPGGATDATISQTPAGSSLAPSESFPPPPGSSPPPDGSFPPPAGSSPPPDGSFPPPGASSTQSFGSFSPPPESSPPPDGSFPPPAGSSPPSDGSFPPAPGSSPPPDGSFPPPAGSSVPPSGSFPPPVGSSPPPSESYPPPPGYLPPSGSSPPSVGSSPPGGIGITENTATGGPGLSQSTPNVEITTGMETGTGKPSSENPSATTSVQPDEKASTESSVGVAETTLSENSAPTSGISETINTGGTQQPESSIIPVPTTPPTLSGDGTSSAPPVPDATKLAPTTPQGIGSTMTLLPNIASTNSAFTATSPSTFGPSSSGVIGPASTPAPAVPNGYGIPGNALVGSSGLAADLPENQHILSSSAVQSSIAPSLQKLISEDTTDPSSVKHGFLGSEIQSASRDQLVSENHQQIAKNSTNSNNNSTILSSIFPPNASDNFKTANGNHHQSSSAKIFDFFKKARQEKMKNENIKNQLIALSSVRKDSVYVKTSGTARACKQDSDCFEMREPNEWCPNVNKKYYEKGCFCNSISQSCIIERNDGGKSEYTDCSSAATSACRFAKKNN